MNEPLRQYKDFIDSLASSEQVEGRIPPYRFWEIRQLEDSRAAESQNVGQAANQPTMSLTDGAGSAELAATVDGNSSSIAAATASRGSLTALGDYDLLEEIARGGMGVVYKARQRRLARVVAMKMILSGEMAGAEAIGRFRAEGEAAAQLDHPNIVPVFDVGEVDGRHYLTMGFVEGQSLKMHLTDRMLSPSQAAEMIATVAAAVHYAHERGIVHRDLKPANILIDATGQPRITDFGLAKRVGDDSHLTTTGQIMGTPSYMPPEQASGKMTEVGPLSDVYSLGATLYHLLTGRPPFQAATVVETLEQVLKQDPLAPRQINRNVPRDLETICLKCLEKEPAKRYGSASLLAEDLRRYLAGEPVRARPIRPQERLVRWARRRPAWAALAATVVGSALLLFIGLGVHSARLDDLNQKLLVQHGITTDALNKSLESERVAAKNERVALRTAADSTFSRALSLCDQGDCATGLLWLVRAVELAEQAGDSELSEALRLNLAAWSGEVYRLGVVGVHSSAVNCVAAQPDGRRVAAGCQDGQVFLWDVSAGKVDGDALPHPSAINAMAFTPDSLTLVTGCADGSLRRWDLKTRELRGEAWLHPSQGERSPLPPKRTGVRALDINKAGTLLASASSDDVRFWDLATGMPQTPIELGGMALGVAFSGDGKCVWTASLNAGVRCWEVAGRTEVGQPFRYATAVALAARPDRLEAIAGYDESARAVRIKEDGTPIEPPLHLGRSPLSIAARSDGKVLATASSDGKVLLWDADSGKLINSSLRGDSTIWDACFLPNQGVVSGSDSGGLRIWNKPDAGPRLSIRMPFTWVRQACFSPDGARILVSGMGARDAWPQVYETSTGNKIEIRYPTAGLGRKDWQAGVGFTRDGIVSAENGRQFYLWNPLTGASRTPVDTEQWVWRMAVSADGQRLITGSNSWSNTKYRNAARVWDTASGRPVGKPLEHATQVWGLALSADGKLAVTGATDGDAALWNADTGELIGPRRRHPSAVNAVAISPNQQQVLTGCDDGFARLWIVPGWLATPVSLEHASAVVSVDFSPAANLLLTASADGIARFWHAGTGRPIGPPLRHDDRVNVIRCHPKGTLALTAADDGLVRIWTIPAAWTGSALSLMQRVEQLTGLRLEASGAIRPLAAAEWQELRRNTPQ